MALLCDLGVTMGVSRVSTSPGEVLQVFHHQQKREKHLSIISMGIGVTKLRIQITWGHLPDAGLC